MFFCLALRLLRTWSWTAPIPLPNHPRRRSRRRRPRSRRTRRPRAGSRARSRTRASSSTATATRPEAGGPLRSPKNVEPVAPRPGGRSALGSNDVVREGELFRPRGPPTTRGTRGARRRGAGRRAAGRGPAGIGVLTRGVGRAAVARHEDRAVAQGTDEASCGGHEGRLRGVGARARYGYAAREDRSLSSESAL